MFNTLKQTLLEDIKVEVEEAKAMLDEIQSLEREIQDLCEPKKEYEYRFANRKFSFYEKHFNRRAKEEYKEKKQAYLDAMKVYEERKKKLPEKLQELRSKKDPKKLQEIIDKYNAIKEAKNIKELGYTFEQVCNLFKEKGIPLVLDKTDTIINNESNFDKLEDFILVHKTSYAPSGDVIKTTGNAGATKKQQIQIGNQTIEIEFPIPRQTVHFTVNSEVKSHEAGNWDSAPYAIIIPFVDVPNVTTFRVEDTFTSGDVDISKGYMLCPADEVENIQKNNPNLTVIGYRGNINPETGKECVSGMANKLLSQLGYKQEEVRSGYGQHPSWIDGDDATKARITIEKNMNVDSIDHNHSKEGVEEDIDIGINQFKAIVEKLLESDFDFDPSEVASQLSSQLVMSSPINGKDRYVYYDDERILAKTGQALWQYDIVLPTYLFDILEKEDTQTVFRYEYGIDKVIDEYKKTPNMIIAKDSIEYIENMKKNKGKKFSSYECLQELIVYETLKQVKKLKQANVNQQESAIAL